MKEIIYNKDNLKDNEIDETVNRVKVLLINSKNELLLGYSHKIYQFVGGHVENGESFEDCIERELLEETGINIKLKSIKPFMCIKHYTKNYRDTGKDRISGIYYFKINCDEKYDLSKTCYTEDELDGKFELRYINIDKIEQVLIDNIPNNKLNEVIVHEMLEAIKEFKKEC